MNEEIEKKVEKLKERIENIKALKGRRNKKLERLSRVMKNLGKGCKNCKHLKLNEYKKRNKTTFLCTEYSNNLWNVFYCSRWKEGKFEEDVRTSIKETVDELELDELIGVHNFIRKLKEEEEDD